MQEGSVSTRPTDTVGFIARPLPTLQVSLAA
jgi:hypothetical protein